MIEVKIECLNPGCKIYYKVDELVVNIEATLKTITDEIIRVMNNRELEHNKKSRSSEFDSVKINIPDQTRINTLTEL